MMVSKEKANMTDHTIDWDPVNAYVINPDPMFRDLSKVEAYLKSEIRKYS